MKHSRKLACLVLAASLLALGLAAAPARALAPADNLNAPDLFGPSPSSGGLGAGWVRAEGYRYMLSAIGDSLTDNGTLHGVFYERLNDPGFAFRSIPGSTGVYWHGLPGAETGDILNNVRSRDLGAGEGVDFVVIMAGTNDIDYSGGEPIETLAKAMVSNMQAIVDDVLGGNHDPNVRPAVIVSGMPPYLDPTQTARAKYYNELLRSTLKRVDVITDASWWDLYNAGTGTAEGWMMDDNKHPNQHGMYRIAENWFEGVDALFNPTRFSAANHLYKGDWYFQRH